MFLYTKVFCVVISISSVVALPARSANEITVNGSPNWLFIPNDRGEIQLAILDEPEVQQRADVKDVKFLLYTRSNPNAYSISVGDRDGLLASSFNPSHPTKFLIHGFGGGDDSSIIVDGKTAYLANGDYNVIGIDWGKLCVSPWYASAVGNTRPVGVHIASMVDFLVSPEIGANLKDIHLIGHSLGSHVAGFAGAYVTSGKVGRITGLDSAKPLFESVDINGCLDATDAELVDVIHTNMDGLGLKDPHGDVDFYPNGGAKQPGCGIDLFGTCSHSKAVEYFIHSIGNERTFPATRCQSLSEAERGSCTGDGGFMGESVSFGNHGLYYVDVK